MTKQDLIINAYGKWWNDIDVLQKGGELEIVNEDGWFNMKHIELMIDCDELFAMCDKRFTNIRPKSIRGIEENNGWTKIEDAFWLKSEKKEDGGRTFWVDGSKDCDCFIFVMVDIIQFPKKTEKAQLSLDHFMWLTTEGGENSGIVPTHYRVVKFDNPMW